MWGRARSPQWVAAGSVAAATVLAGCAASTQASVPYAWSSASPGAVSPFVGAVKVQAQADRARRAPGDTVRVSIRWQNTPGRDVEGTSRVLVRAPGGLKVKASPGCHHALVNDLVCDFRGGLAAGAAVTRGLVFTVDGEGLPVSGVTPVVSLPGSRVEVPLRGK